MPFGKHQNKSLLKDKKVLHAHYYNKLLLHFLFFSFLAFFFKLTPPEANHANESPQDISSHPPQLIV